MAKEKKARPWIKDLLVAFAGTTLSIILTFGTSTLVNHVNRNRDRRLTALMVLSSIESSVRSLEESGDLMARKDTVAQWLLSIPLSDVKKLDPDVLMPSITEVMIYYAVSTDKTIENIFSSNTDTWKNMGNFQFIDNVGKCYSAIRFIEEDWKVQRQSISAEYLQIMEHPEKYPGKTLPEKILSNPEVRSQIGSIRAQREWLSYIVESLRESNRRNMSLIGISEEEVMAFTDERSQLGYSQSEDKVAEDYLKGAFSIPPISRDSMYTMQSSTHLLDSLLQTPSGKPAPLK